MATDGQPTTSFTRFVGKVYADDTPPTAAELGEAVAEGHIYIDNENDNFCWYNDANSQWICVAGTASLATSTSTTTSTSTSTTTTET